ncbi:MAG: hypothetical protein EBX50_23175 [Chitinophagia bacterium]|nr:hypothetical protein [Chitinophagia bacterium]
MYNKQTKIIVINLLFGVFFGMSLGPLPNILAAELFPTAVRGPP